MNEIAQKLSPETTLYLIIYCACTLFNIIFIFCNYKEILPNYLKTSKHWVLFWILIITGPLLTICEAYIYIRRRIKMYYFKKELNEAIKRELPNLLKKYNITIEN